MRRRDLGTGFLGAAAALACHTAGIGRAYADPASLVVVRRGDLPVIVSAPHGGRDPVPGATSRRADGSSRIVVVRDENTLELAEATADAIAARLGGTPHLVAARFKRRFVDANRPARDAYEPDAAGAAAAVYAAYHGALARAVADVQRRHGRGLLIDLHGHGRSPDLVFRGTRNGTTVRGLVSRFGRAALTGPQSFFGVLASRGHRVVPAVDSDDREEPGFSGGEIVARYGGGAVDAIQIELGRNARSSGAISTTARDIAEAAAVHRSAFLRRG